MREKLAPTVGARVWFYTPLNFPPGAPGRIVEVPPSDLCHRNYAVIAPDGKPGERLHLCRDAIYGYDVLDPARLAADECDGCGHGPPGTPGHNARCPYHLLRAKGEVNDGR